MEKFKGFTKEQIESFFDQFNSYGLGLLFSTILAWENSREKNRMILRTLYDEAVETKEEETREEYRTPYSDKNGLIKTLKGLEEDEFNFLKELLTLNPRDVFKEDPYANHRDPDTDESEYDIFKKYFNAESKRRFGDKEEKIEVKRTEVDYTDSLTLEGQRLIDECNKRFSERFNRSMNADKVKYVNTDELFSKRFYRSLKLKRPTNNQSE